MNQLLNFIFLFLILVNISYGKTIEKFLSKWPEQPFLIYVPSNNIEFNEKPNSLIISLHGAGSNAEEQQLNSCANGKETDFSCLDRLADKKNIIVVYPNGKKIGKGCRLNNRNCFPRHWQPTGPCGNFATNETNLKITGDNAYLLDVLNYVKREFNIESKSVYFSGMSNGAAMAFDISCQLKKQVSGVALIAGHGLLLNRCGCTNGIRPKIIQFHGTQDPVWSYDSSKKFISGLAKIGECSENAQTKLLLDFDKNDGTTVTKLIFENCKNGPLAHYKIIGGGHTWPNGFHYSDKVGSVSRDISANEEMWNFFQSLP